MVHRPADSRLLTNLLSHEKEYSKQFDTLFDFSHASLASFSAYASASAPPASHVIIAVAGTLAGADEALRKYAASLDQWQQQLKALKDMEDEVGNIMRDREILVTRLIKASKQQKPTRDSIIGASPSTSSLSFSKPEVLVGNKLGAAQSELQACEAHLASKERELDGLRVSAMQQGLHVRCKAMVECGWTWGEMGKEGLRALEALSADAHINGRHPYAHPAALKPLPIPGSDSGHMSSDLSSIAPSQSASQVTHEPDGSLTWHGSPASTIHAPYSLQIPPAHSIGDFTVPNGRISEEDEEGAGSSADEDAAELPIEVHENARFAKGAKGKTPDRTFSLRRERESSGESSASPRVHFPPSPPQPNGNGLAGRPDRLRRGSGSQRQRSGSTGMFGSIAALFHHKDRHKDDDEDGSPQRKGRPAGKWSSRTDRRLAHSGRGDDSSDEDRTRVPFTAQFPTWSSVNMSRSESPLPVTSPSVTQSESGMQRLRKKTKRTSVQEGPTSVLQRTSEAERGWLSDGAASGYGAKAKVSPKRSRNQTEPVLVHMNGDATPTATASGGVRSKKPVLTGGIPAGSLSRDSSLSKHSAVGTPPRSSVPAAHPAPPPAHRRTSSLEITVPDGPLKSSPPLAPHVKTHKRALSVSGPPASRSGLTRVDGQPSLMSIVEGVTRQNKQAWALQDPNRLLVVPKAPPPVNIRVDDMDERLPIVATKNTSPSSAVRTPAREPVRNSSLLSPSASAPSLPISRTNGTTTSPKTPLRSALRNSRTPSPNPAATPPLAPTGTSASPPNAPNGVEAALAALTANSRRDSMSSISSYETVHEVFDDDDEPQEASPPPPPPHDHPAAGGSDVSQSTASTTVAPVRRKSVRMSLPPTFSETPPALEDDSGEERRGRHHPWDARGRRGAPHGLAAPRVEEEPDRWVDSSDEDEEYSAAKRLLSRAARRRT